MLLIFLIVAGSFSVSVLAWVLLKASDENGDNKYKSPALRGFLGFLRLLGIAVGLFFLTGLLLMLRPGR